MKIKNLILLLLFMFFLVPAQGKSPLDLLLVQLDSIIQNSEIHTNRREERIRKLKEKIRTTDRFSPENYDLNRLLYAEYRSYICDSALLYISKSIDIAEYLKDDGRKYESMLQLAYLMGSTGMYKEGIDVLESIERQKLPAHLLVNYYSAYLRVYGELGYYTQDKKRSGYYARISTCYRDSFLRALPANSEDLLISKEDHLRYRGKLAEALEINSFRLANKKTGTPEHALTTYQRALIFQQKRNMEEAKYWYTMSAISDISAAIKDHASLWKLARILYEEGDIDRAYNYIRFSWSETVFYNARLRNLQTAVILSLIDNTYQIKIKQKNEKLQNYLILISILALILIGSSAFIYRQMKKLSIARRNLQNANRQLKELNEELQSVNAHLQNTNINLEESNQIKEEYIGRFLKLCSTYIEKLATYRKMANKKIMNGQIDELLKINRSQDVLDKELNELYANFDTAFLRFYPNFVAQVNELLQKNDPITPKKGEMFNTELRILALIRLGIDDSAQIADFLRYSLNTIYNYRAKMKNKASIPRDDFENRIKMIR